MYKKTKNCDNIDLMKLYYCTVHSNKIILLTKMYKYTYIYTKYLKYCCIMQQKMVYLLHTAYVGILHESL